MNGPAAGSKIPLAVPGEMWSWESLAHERNWQTIDVAMNLARIHGRSVPNIVSRWLLDGGNCDAILIGAASAEQLSENLKVLDFALEQSQLEQLRSVSEPTKTYPRNFHDLFCRKESEFYGGLR
jgi:aryl-alcohol dehydrogenase-like predicted oxidoreductase